MAGNYYLNALEEIEKIATRRMLKEGEALADLDTEYDTPLFQELEEQIKTYNAWSKLYHEINNIKHKYEHSEEYRTSNKYDYC